jgi:hypothetical protein
MLAAGMGALRVMFSPNAEVFSPQLRDIWTAVHDRTSPHALIFTDQTGAEQSRLKGFNDYSLISQRQFYISSWVAGPLRLDKDAREERLATNEAVLSGQIEPTSIPLRNSYSDYFAVVSNERVAPSSFELRYRNESFSLYRITSRN